VRRNLLKEEQNEQLKSGVGTNEACEMRKGEENAKTRQKSNRPEESQSPQPA
jgi:hypothetical protein